jgi:hypothetical protein
MMNLLLFNKKEKRKKKNQSNTIKHEFYSILSQRQITNNCLNQMDEHLFKKNI